MFAWVILAYLQKLGTHLGLGGGYFITIFWVEIGLKRLKLKILLVQCNNAG